MLFGETVAVYCENHTEHTIHCVGRIQRFGMLKQVIHIDHWVTFSAHVLCCPLQVPTFQHYTIYFVATFNLVISK
jgi:hypothetical protein